MWVNTSKFAGKDNNEIYLVGILFLIFLYNFEFVLGFLYFSREVFGIMYGDLLYSCYSLPFFSFILYTPTRLFFEWHKQKII